MPKGGYVAVRFETLPSLSDLKAELGGEFTACYYPDFRGGFLVEIVTQNPEIAPWINWAPVHCLDFFVDSFLGAGGVCICDGEQVHVDPLSQKARKTLGLLTHILDDVDVSHPLAEHASEYAIAF